MNSTRTRTLTLTTVTALLFASAAPATAGGDHTFTVASGGLADHSGNGGKPAFLDSVQLNDREWACVTSSFAGKAATKPSEERAQIARAYQLWQMVVWNKTGWTPDKGGWEGNHARDRGQTNCQNTADNVGGLLRQLDHDGFLNFHTVVQPHVRGTGADLSWNLRQDIRDLPTNFEDNFGGHEHWTAVLAQFPRDPQDWCSRSARPDCHANCAADPDTCNKLYAQSNSDTYYAVDPWPFGEGEGALVEPLGIWNMLRDNSPEDLANYNQKLDSIPSACSGLVRLDMTWVETAPMTKKGGGGKFLSR